MWVLPAGLHKLHKTAEEVAELQKDLAAMRPSLLKAQQETVVMLDRIAADTASYTGYTDPPGGPRAASRLSREFHFK